MKAAIFLSLLALASAFPKQKKPIVWETTNNEFNLEKKNKETCPGLLLLWARGTGQEGNMVCILNPHLHSSFLLPLLSRFLRLILVPPATLMHQNTMKIKLTD